MPKVSNERTLIIGPSWVGDMVMAQALFVLLKRRFPRRAIDVMAPAWTRPLLARMPEVSESIDMPLGHGQFQFAERYRMGEELRGRYSNAVILPNSWKSALIPFFAGIPERTGWRGEMRFFLLDDIRLLSKRRYPLMVQRYVALGLPPGAPMPDPMPMPHLVADVARVPALYSEFGLNHDKPILALCPGAEFGPSKQWPVEHYAAVAQAKINDGWQVWIMGSAKDAPVAAAIQSQIAVSNPVSDQAKVMALAGKTDLSQAIDLLSQADAVISNDSGLMHIAAALGRPLVAVYGSTSPAFTPPLGEHVTTESIPVDCGPCFKRECPLQHHKCLVGLPPQQVLSGLERINATVVE